MGFCMAAVGPYSHFISEKTIDELGKDIESGKDDKFKKLLSILSKDKIAHPFMKQSPLLCCKLVPLIRTTLQGGKISKEQVTKVMVQLTKNDVFTKGSVPEDVVILCKEGKEVPISGTLLGFSSDYFMAMLSNGLKESIRDGTGNRTINFSKEYQLATIQAMKSYIYSGKFSEIDDIGVLVELYNLSRLMQSKPLEKYCADEINKRADKVKSTDELDKMVASFSSTETKTKLLFDLQNRALKSYLKANDIKFIPSKEEGCIQLDISKLGLLAHPGALGSLLTTYTTGVVVSREEQLEEIELLLFMPDKAKENFREITFTINPSGELVASLSVHFANIEQVTRPFLFDVGQAKEFKFHIKVYALPIESLKANQGSLKEHFKKLESIHYSSHSKNPEDLVDFYISAEAKVASYQDLVPATFSWKTELYSNGQTSEELQALSVFKNYAIVVGGTSGRIWDFTRHCELRKL
jgi:hypothetical protein